MKKEFASVKYVGGLPSIPVSVKVKVVVDTTKRVISLSDGYKANGTIPFENIIDVSLNEKSLRSGGKAALGAIVGGVLTGGVGLIAGAALGGRKRDASSIYITHKANGQQLDLVLRPNGQTDNLYASISSAISLPAPADFDRENIKEPATAPANTELTTGGAIVLLVFVIIIFLFIKSCNS